jgi:nucleotide-binding universal stress UspA family protein
VLKISRILVPVEFSPRCRGAAQYAEALAGRFRSEIVLLHVIPEPTTSFSALETMAYSSAADLARELFAERTAELADFPCGPPGIETVRRVVMEGDPARVIVAYAASEHCDLIVMPTHGYGTFRRFLLGSVTAKILHDAICPVWTGPHMERAPDFDRIEFGHVVCAIDLGPHTREVLCYAGCMAASLNAPLSVIHALPASATRIGGFYFDPDWSRELARAARERIGILLADLGLHAGIIIESGETPIVVRTAAQDAHADLVLIGRGSTPRAHGHLPTNSYAIVRESPCPVVAL